MKVILLYGYLPYDGVISNGDEAADLLLETVEQHQRQSLNLADEIDEDMPHKWNRSYGNISRAQEIVAQDDGTGAISEVLAARLYPLPAGCTVDEWLDQVQALLDEKLEAKNRNTNPSSSFKPIRLLGRQDLPNTCTKFNAETDVTHRRVEYFLPVGFFQNMGIDYSTLKESMPTFEENHRHSLTRHDAESAPSPPDPRIRDYLQLLKKTMRRMATRVETLDMKDKGAVMEKEFNMRRRKRHKVQKMNTHRRAKARDSESHRKKEAPSHTSIRKVPCDSGDNLAMDKTHKVLRRKRFHNFTTKVLAHDYLAYRRLDRIYHRATLRFPNECRNSQESVVTAETGDSTPFMVLSLTGDLFLTGQVCRVIGLILAIANGVIDSDIVDCVFDEDYPHLIPTPPAPVIGMVAGVAFYTSWEGKTKSILSPRVCDRYNQGWNQQGTLYRSAEWQNTVYQEIARRWLQPGFDESTGLPKASQEWYNEVLLPWAKRAKIHLEDYRRWSDTHNRDSVTTKTEGSLLTKLSEPLMDGALPRTQVLTSPLESVEPSVPQPFVRVLQLLRDADTSGLWPSTSLNRQLVMVSTLEMERNRNSEQSKPDSLALLRVKAKGNKEERLSAYSYLEGEGGASGSFSVGSMPDDRNKQPKGNALFPELVKAAFELELALCPDREPSSTIAINRNAQFRPHTDNGAGAGQSTSLIVGLGTYAGGELMVEGEKHDIRYKALEFNGWTQRHWTMPFSGERYSLVWFTPKGCEGLKGIDLDLLRNK